MTANRASQRPVLLQHALLKLTLLPTRRTQSGKRAQTHKQAINRCKVDGIFKESSALGLALLV